MPAVIFLNMVGGNRLSLVVFASYIEPQTRISKPRTIRTMVTGLFPKK